MNTSDSQHCTDHRGDSQPNQLLEFAPTLQWLEKSMPKAFYRQVSHEERKLIVSGLLSLLWQEGFVTLRSKHRAYCITNNDENADLRALEAFKDQEIWDYRTFVSLEPAPFLPEKGMLRIIIIHFLDESDPCDEPLEQQYQEEIWEQLQARGLGDCQKSYTELLNDLSKPFLRLLPKESLIVTLDLLLRARREEDSSEFEILPEIFWQQMQRPSMQIILTVRQARQNHFLRLLMKLVKRHSLFVQRINSTLVAPHSGSGLLLIVFSLHGLDNRPVWEVTKIPEFLRELTMLKMLPRADLFEEVLVDGGHLSSTMAHLLRAMSVWVHQMLVPLDANLYSFDNVKEAFLRHPKLSKDICELFSLRYHPGRFHLDSYKKEKERLITYISNLSTGHSGTDTRRRHILLQAIHFIDYTLKTNFFKASKHGLSFRLDPKVLEHLPYNRQEIFPELPFAIFFIRCTQSFGFHIRFRDLARGGLRTILPTKSEQLSQERANIFKEAYNLALTQQKKNKDIPEGGSKAALLLHPFQLEKEQINALEKSLSRYHGGEAEQRLYDLIESRRTCYLYYTQKCFIRSLLELVNCFPSGMLKTRGIVDYYQRPEYIYLGPDENMHNSMIEWIADFSCSQGYAPGPVFISSHPKRGINHKEYGVTSLGVHTYMKEVLRHLKIGQNGAPFTVKMSGGPDGDVAGNCLKLLARDFPQSAKVVAITDVSGTINDPQGLDLGVLVDLFERQKPINAYPPEKLGVGGFLLDRFKTREGEDFSQETLCWRNDNNGVSRNYINNNEMHFLYRNNVHRTPADIFIPAGGRPRTLNEENVGDFYLEDGTPSAKAIVEGANLYLTPSARKLLQEKGVLIFKDSSANKGGVMSSSLEVLYGLLLEEEEFLSNKKHLCDEILKTIEAKSSLEAQLLLRSQLPLTQASDLLSEKINLYTDQLYEALTEESFSQELLDKYPDLLQAALVNFCPPAIREKYSDRLKLLPQSHSMAMIATHLASQLIYQRGLSWSPSLSQALPLLLGNPVISGAVLPSQTKN